MKKLSFLLLCTLLPAFVFSQGFYFRAGLGYAFAQAGQTMYQNGIAYGGSLNYSTQNYSLKSASLSAGVQSSLAVGYLINKNVGVQLDLNLNIAPKKYTFTINNAPFTGGFTGDVTLETQSKSLILTTPSVVLQTGGDVWNLYSRFGIVIPLNTKITQHETDINSPGTGARQVDVFTYEIKNSFSPGFSAAIGIQYKLNERLSLWGEASMLSLTQYIKQQELKEITVDGAGYPLTSYTGNIITNYSKNITVNSSQSNLPAYAQPFSNVGINFGIRVALFGNSGGAGRKGQVTERPKPSKFR